MLLKKFRVGIPAGAFVAISTLFLLIQLYVVDLILWNYYLCHVLFGFTFPLVLGYMTIPPKLIDPVPFRLFWAQVKRTPPKHWPQAVAGSITRDLEKGVPWSPVAGVVMTLFFSILNEMIVDPETNGVPFTSAYGHFIADVAGLVLFLLVSHWGIDRNNTSAGMQPA